MTRNKYNAKKVTTEEGTFDSQAEYRRWCELKLLEKAGEIRDLRRQTKFPLEFNGVKFGFYKDDFDYRPANDVTITVEDLKGVKTAIYRLKKKLMKAVHGIDILETPAGKRRAA